MKRSGAVATKFGAGFARRVKVARPKPGTTWHLDQHGTRLDILLQKRRDKAAAKRFFKRVLASCPEVPRKIDRDRPTP